MSFIIYITINYIIGALLEFNSKLNSKIFFGLGAILFLLFICLYIINYVLKITIDKKWFLFNTGLLFIFIAIINIKLRRNSFYKDASEISAYSVNIIDEVNENKFYKYTIGEINKIKSKGNWAKISCRIFLSFPKATNLEYGDELIIKGKLKNVGLNKFDQYLLKINIPLKETVKSNNFKVIDSKPKNMLKYYAIKIKSKIESIFKNQFKDNDAVGIILSLTLGTRSLLNNEIKKLHIDTGTIHLLAISGLHIGMIVKILSFFLSLFLRRKSFYFVRETILFITVWSYTFITGFSPSITRASTMFSFKMLNDIKFKNSSFYNIIFVSILLILFIDPFLINQVGFVFSCMAVLGIIYLQPKIYNLIRFKNRFLNYFWEVITISLAAQLFVAPLSIYYFHQFPTYFLIANIVLVPLAFVILFLSILFLVTFYLSFFSNCIVFILEKLIYFSLQFLKLVNKFPYSTFSNIEISFGEVIIIYLTIIIFCQLFYKTQKR